MKRIKVVGLCLVAVFAFGAVAVASASAAPAPTFGKCITAVKVGKKYTGKYNNKTCTTENTKSEGKYELETVESGTVTSKTKTATFTLAGKVVKCTKGTDLGEIISLRVVTETITFEGCSTTETVTVKGKPKTVKVACESAGKKAGTIATESLNGQLVWINEGETEPGFQLRPEESEVVADITCGAETVSLEGGGLLGTIKNSTNGITITFAVSNGEQAHKVRWLNGGSREFDLFTPGEVEATLATIDEQGPKGVGVYPA